MHGTKYLIVQQKSAAPARKTPETWVSMYGQPHHSNSLTNTIRIIWNPYSICLVHDS
jgi:hypothetical protein